MVTARRQEHPPTRLLLLPGVAVFTIELATIRDSARQVVAADRG